MLGEVLRKNQHFKHEENRKTNGISRYTEHNDFDNGIKKEIIVIICAFTPSEHNEQSQC